MPSFEEGKRVYVAGHSGVAGSAIVCRLPSPDSIGSARAWSMAGGGGTSMRLSLAGGASLAALIGVRVQRRISDAS